ncbi:MAG: M24 family metallopeptidase [candidate division KSB1 bacterium]|nr:M24 family metallopeptidase [candidate division KSB1 bacterium]MDZ7274422.1 M24 family metallopeptidase [candidate division KSB1 bacterium]MDZ7284916.1 M24 family metallopeptidase [candidate division KSB1 bacterium]MDZ7297663.1 M24 family metallopeptidase [candidate division KSB1 bacterium]MDZ7305913.1 M24 family metallopeptidase [candidate division KSB1 bacterium]
MKETPVFSLDIAAVQAALRRDGLAGWLIYDFRGLNAVARELFNLADYHITRRWFYFIPQAGEPVLLGHAIEKMNLPPLPGRMMLYAGLQQMRQRLDELLPRPGKIAMEYSPGNDVPTASYLDAGMFELLRSLNVEIVTSANLIQEFTARWSAEQLRSHVAAAHVVDAAQRAAFKMIEAALQAGRPLNEYEVQQFILQRFAQENCFTDSPPIVAVNGNASNPHYAPTATQHSPIRKGDVILIDLWARKKTPRAVFADITWVGFAGREVPPAVQKVFDIVRQARDLGVDFLRQNWQAGKPVKGYQIDEVVRRFITQAGYGEYFVHRTGHSLGTEVHASGVNIDSFETRDSRDIIPGLAFSIEPGIYLPEFGVRLEINVYAGENGPEIYTEPQHELVRLQV